MRTRVPGWVVAGCRKQASRRAFPERPSTRLAQRPPRWRLRSGKRTVTSYALSWVPVPNRGSYMNPQQRQAHEQPVIFYSIILGLIGPVMVVTVPPVRKSLGWRPAEPIPTSYPGEYRPTTYTIMGRTWRLMDASCLPVPNRSRRAVQGYEDE